MVKMDEYSWVAAPINPLYVYFNLTQIIFLQIMLLFRHQLVVIGVCLMYVNALSRLPFFKRASSVVYQQTDIHLHTSTFIQ